MRTVSVFAIVLLPKANQGCFAVGVGNTVDGRCVFCPATCQARLDGR